MLRAGAGHSKRKRACARAGAGARGVCGAARGRDVIGKPVIVQGSGRRVGRVGDLLLDPAGRRVAGLLVAGGRMVALPSLRGIGTDVVLCDDLPVPLPPAGLRPWSELRRLSGKPVLSQAGQAMGTLDDVVFDEATGEISGFRISGGFIQDLVEGRSLLPGDALSVNGGGALVATTQPRIDLGPDYEG